MPSSVHSDDCYYQNAVMRGHNSAFLEAKEPALREDSHEESGGSGPESERPPPGCCQRLFPAGYKQELKATLRIAYGMVVIFICNQAMQPIAVMFGGHLGALELDAVALGAMLINVVGNSVVIGLCTACDTLFSQTYGSGNYFMIGVQLQTTIFIIGCTLLLCLAIHLNVETLLVLMGQDPMVAHLTGQYCLYFIPGMVFLFGAVILNRFLVSQSIVWPQVVVYIFGIMLHALFQYIFLYVLDLGLRGSAWAQTIAYFNNFITTLIYCLHIKIFKKTWNGWSWQCLEEWWSFTKLAVAGMLMVCLEWWAFEILIILAGLLGTVELGAQGVLFNWNQMMFAIPGGIGMTVAIRVGQELGAGRTLHAQTASRIGYTITIFVTATVFTLTVSLRNYMPRVFTSDPEVIDLAAKILPLLAIFKIFDDMTVVTRFGVRGMGKQAFGTATVFLSYYFVGLPSGISMMFYTPLRSAGLWVGNAIAMCLCLITFVLYVNCWVDWHEITKQARRRAGVLKRDTGSSQSSAQSSVEVLKANEKTSLLDGNQNQKYAPYQNHSKPKSVTFNIFEDDTSRFQDRNYLIPLVIKRVITVSVFVGILITGVFCHIYVDINDISNYNYTNPAFGASNFTTLAPQILNYTMNPI